MKSLFRKTYLFSLFFLIFSVTSAFSGQPSVGQKQKANNCFIIVANGLRYNDALGNKNHLYTENIWTKLRPLGSICVNFYNSAVTYPIPAQASLLTGVWHIFENPLSTKIRPAFPTLFEYWNKKSADPAAVPSYFASTIVQYEILTHSEYNGFGGTYAPIFETIIKSCSIEEDSSGKKDNTIYPNALKYIFEHHPSLVYLNLDYEPEKSPSHALECRVEGCSDKEAEHVNSYYESIIMIDSIVYDLWSRVQDDSVYKDNSVFIFLSTHGRHTDDFHGYGDGCRGCRQLNLLIIGPGIKKNYISKKKRTLIDICPTVGELCNIPTPFAKGKIMKEILE